jgi:S1-C subfamily serine protease
VNRQDFWKIVAASSAVSTVMVLLALQWSSPAPAVAEFRQPETITFDNPLSEDERVNIEIYEALSRSVVNVTSTRLELGFWLQPVPRQGTGSGFLIDDRGLILTNHHVIQDARQLQITLFDESKHDAEIVGRDPLSDLALLRIDCPPGVCRPIKLSEGADLRVGQKVLAIGNPFGLERTLTTGVISSLGRSLETREGVIDDLIQSDAAINPGNSGGPLLNTRGEVIGINSAIISGTGQNVGIGFAVPARTISRVLPDLLEHGRVLRPVFGVSGRPLGRQLARALDIPVEEGFLIEQVARGGTADAAGLRGGNRRVFYGNVPILIGGDVLVSLAGQNIQSRNDVVRAIQDRRPGERVPIVYYRDGRRVETEIELIGPEPAERHRF